MIETHLSYLYQSIFKNMYVIAAIKNVEDNRDNICEWQRGRLLKIDWYKYDKCVSIIVLSLMSNFLLAGKKISYMIWVLSFIWLMKMIRSNEGTIAPRGKVELWYEKEYKDQLRQWWYSALLIYLMLQRLDTLIKSRRASKKNWVYQAWLNEQ